MLAASSSDGNVYIIESKSVHGIQDADIALSTCAGRGEPGTEPSLFPREWSVSHVFKATGLTNSTTTIVDRRRADPVTCLCWRPALASSNLGSGDSEYATGAASLLLVTGSVRSKAKVWAYRPHQMRWVESAIIGEGGGGGGEGQKHVSEDGNHRSGAVTAVSWAPRLAQPSEILAIAWGATSSEDSQVWLVSLEGEADRLHAKVLHRLTHQSDVCSIQWDALGMDFAVSLENGAIVMWELRLDGNWHRKATEVTVEKLRAEVAETAAT